MKTILIFSFSSDDWAGYRKTLEPMLAGTDISLKEASLQDLRPLPEDIIAVLASSYEMALFAEEYLLPGIPVLWINHTLEKEMVFHLKEISRQSRISVASDTMFNSESRCRMLINLGIREERLRAWCPDMDEDQLEPCVLVFENPRISEKEGRILIPIENRGLIGADTLMELFGSIGRLDLLNTEVFRDYFQRVFYKARRANDILDIGDYYVEKRDKGVKNGFVMFSSEERIINYCDRNAMTLLQKTGRQLYGRSIYDVFPFLQAHQEKIGKPGEELLLYDGRKLAFDIWNTSTHGTYIGYMLIMDEEAQSRKELRLRRLKIEKKHRAKYTFRQIIGESPAIVRCRQIAKNMAQSSASVLITGPSGCGKELFAQAIHNASPRRDKPFISVNCGALVESLLESELFGYEGGAFTGARREGKAGLFELAHEGTLFLDEIGEMPLTLQVKLLRVLQEKEVVRVGGHDVIPVDVRIIAATNRNLSQLVHEGKFRLDLYYRLNVLPLSLPGLNERREDIPLLCSVMQQENGLTFSMNQEVMDILKNHSYEGNVRELLNCLEYLGSLGRQEIVAEDLPPYMKEELCEEETYETDSLHPKYRGGIREDDRKKVLEAVREINAAGIGAGRRSIAALLRSRGEPIPEMRIRAILKELEQSGEVTAGSGRAGVRLRK